MKPAFYRKKWTALREGKDRQQLTHLGRQIAMSFLDRYFYNDQLDQEYIELLCEMSTSFEEDELNKAGSSALFGIIVEGLCDDFEELQTEAYNKVMSFVVSFCTTVPTGKAFADRLRDFGLASYPDILQRIEGIRARSDEPRTLSWPPRKFILLSRVTIGADVAITSVLIQRLVRLFPHTELVIVGSKKLREIYGGNPKVRIREVNYSRHGNLLERFTSWFATLKAINDELEDDPANVFVVDPDSRLSQLGVLPVVQKDKYLFFNSRGKDSYPKKMSIAELTNHWLDKVLGTSEFCYPLVWPPRSDLDKAVHFVDGLRKAGCRKIIVINFGVGGNSRKRLGNQFEEKLVLNLLEEPDTVIVLDRGFGNEEFERSLFLIRSAEKHGFDAVCAEFDQLHDVNISRGVVGVTTGIGEIASLISLSDEFVGYDSACQHIAAALGVPSYTVFAGSNNPRFIRRWSACGPAKSEIIHVDTLAHPPLFEAEDVVTRIMDARSEKI